VNDDGTFDVHGVFPGSYYLIAATPFRGPKANTSAMLGGMLRVEVADRPLNVSLALHSAVDISGKVEIEGDARRVTPGQVHLQLDPAIQFSFAGSIDTQAGEDGSFTLKGVLPGEWRIRISAPGAYLKSARMGGEDFTDRPLNLMAGAAGMLDIVASTNTGTVQGTAPAGDFVFAENAQNDQEQSQIQFQVQTAVQVDANGHFRIDGLAPGKYRFAAAEDGAAGPEAGQEVDGQEVTVAAGETATVELK
jgi:hypothetical protein